MDARFLGDSVGGLIVRLVEGRVRVLTPLGGVRRDGGVDFDGLGSARAESYMR